MRIYDDRTGRRLSGVTLILTESQIAQFQSFLENLLKSNEDGDHSHLSNEDYQKEITLCVYDPSKLSNFSSRVRKLIVEDV